MNECYICKILTEEQAPCNLQPVSAVLNFVQRLQALLLSRHALLVFALSCLARPRGLSRARRHVWDRADTQFLAFSSTTFCSML